MNQAIRTRIYRTITVLLLAGALIGASSGGQPGAAQDGTPAPGGLASSYLPGAESFGDGWGTLPPSSMTDLNTLIFQEGAAGYYVGPEGARAMVLVFLLTDARVTTRQAWDDVSSRFDTLRYRLTSDVNRDTELAAIPPPEGCEEVKRAEGSDSFSLPNAITLCAGANNVIVLAMVSGGDAATLRYEAADALAWAAMARGGQ
ncbi:MAG: hypothetical protein QM692_10040 [Thermomicrobiales bacterium]